MRFLMFSDAFPVVLDVFADCWMRFLIFVHAFSKSNLLIFLEAFDFSWSAFAQLHQPSSPTNSTCGLPAKQGLVRSTLQGTCATSSDPSESHGIHPNPIRHRSINIDRSSSIDRGNPSIFDRFSYSTWNGAPTHSNPSESHGMHPDQNRHQSVKTCNQQ